MTLPPAGAPLGARGRRGRPPAGRAAPCQPVRGRAAGTPAEGARERRPAGPREARKNLCETSPPDVNQAGLWRVFSVRPGESGAPGLIRDVWGPARAGSRASYPQGLWPGDSGEPDHNNLGPGQSGEPGPKDLGSGESGAPDPKELEAQRKRGAGPQKAWGLALRGARSQKTWDPARAGSRTPAA